MHLTPRTSPFDTFANGSGGGRVQQDGASGTKPACGTKEAAGGGKRARASNPHDSATSAEEQDWVRLKESFGDAVSEARAALPGAEIDSNKLQLLEVLGSGRCVKLLLLHHAHTHTHPSPPHWCPGDSPCNLLRDQPTCQCSHGLLNRLECVHNVCFHP